MALRVRSTLFYAGIASIRIAVEFLEERKTGNYGGLICYQIRSWIWSILFLVINSKPMRMLFDTESLPFFDYHFRCDSRILELLPIRYKVINVIVSGITQTDQPDFSSIVSEVLSTDSPDVSISLIGRCHLWKNNSRISFLKLRSGLSSYLGICGFAWTWWYWIGNVFVLRALTRYPSPNVLVGTTLSSTVVFCWHWSNERRLY